MNMYFPIYQSLEEETLKLTHDIQFTDDQLKVYSLHIGNLIIRCAIEIESISKDLYKQLGGSANKLYFDTDCLKLLVNKWKIDKKKLQIKNANMYFSKKHSILIPLCKSHIKGPGGSEWKSAYQGIKHNRSKEIKKANIENLLNALGALYILNLYYNDESFYEGAPIRGKEPFRNNSNIFTPYICDATKVDISYEMGDNYMEEIKNPSREESIYIKKFSEDMVRDIHYTICYGLLNCILKIECSGEYLEYITKYPNEKDKPITEIAPKIGFDINQNLRKDRNINSMTNDFIKSSKEIILNKESQIYPTQTYKDFLKTDQAKKLIEDFKSNANIH